MEKYINVIKDFLLENRMKLNDGKTEFLIMGMANKLKKVFFDDIKIGHVQMKVVNKAKNLGVMYDSEGKLIQHVSNICKIGFYHIRNLAVLILKLQRQQQLPSLHHLLSIAMHYWMVSITIRSIKYNWYKTQQQG